MVHSDGQGISVQGHVRSWYTDHSPGDVSLPDLWSRGAPGLFKLLSLLTTLGWCSESGLSWLWKMYNFWTEPQVFFRDCSAFTGPIENVSLGPVTSLAWFKKFLHLQNSLSLVGLAGSTAEGGCWRNLGARKRRWQDWAEDKLTGNVGITEALHALMGSSGARVALPGCLLLRRRAGPVYSWISQWLAAGCPFQGRYLRTFSVSQQQPGMGTLALKMKSGWSTLSQRI